ncbi:hypothetical protein ACGFRB_18355 [Streptomyces sp. NPDC048718]|uniref:hypothetical protein n=1 Tax=Streptomyces sp. NPDC048718 TaxID=3365587 RepID=UPI0037225DB4
MDLSFYKSFISEEIRDEGRAQGRAEGRAEGRAMALLILLEQRGLEVSKAVSDRITTCDDPEQLDRWLRRAITVTHADKIFTPEDD